jgi:hypothetical protein
MNEREEETKKIIVDDERKNQQTKGNENCNISYLSTQA